MFANLMDPLSPRTTTVFIFTKAPLKKASNACRKDAKKAQSRRRKAPPFSAKACQGEIKEGKGGEKYKSVQIKEKTGKRKGKTYWRWKHVKEEPAAQKKPAREPVEVFQRNIKETDGIAVKETLAGGASPSFKDQIKGAILTLKDRRGISLQGIKKALNTTPAQSRFVVKALRKGVESGFFIKNKGKYKLSPRPPQKKKKKKKKRTSSSQLKQMKDKEEMKKIRRLSQALFKQRYPNENWREQTNDVKTIYFIRAFLEHKQIHDLSKTDHGVIPNSFIKQNSYLHLNNIKPSENAKDIISQIKKALPIELKRKQRTFRYRTTSTKKDAKKKKPKKKRSKP
jgi:histone H1/5